MGVDCIYGAAGNVDGCCATIVTEIISNRRTIIVADGGNVGIFFNIDREIPGIALLSGTDGATRLVGFCMYGGIPGDRNRSGELFITCIITCIYTAIANGRTPSTVCIDNGVIFNRDAVSAAGTAADRSALLTNSSNMGIALNADVLAGTAVGVAAVVVAGSAAAANAGTARV